MSRVFWDTNLFIYLVEDYRELSQKTARLMERMLNRQDLLLTSTLTLGEVLVKPALTGNARLREEYERIVARYAVLLPLDVDAARFYAQIRTDRTLKAPDAIQLACAAKAGVDLFITNDDRLGLKKVPGIQFITSLEKAPL